MSTPESQQPMPMDEAVAHAERLSPEAQATHDILEAPPATASLPDWEPTGSARQEASQWEWVTQGAPTAPSAGLSMKEATGINDWERFRLKALTTRNAINVIVDEYFSQNPPLSEHPYPVPASMDKGRQLDRMVTDYFLRRDANSPR